MQDLYPSVGKNTAGLKLFLRSFIILVFVAESLCILMCYRRNIGFIAEVMEVCIRLVTMYVQGLLLTSSVCWSLSLYPLLINS